MIVEASAVADVDDDVDGADVGLEDELEFAEMEPFNVSACEV
jgi:hypothetical protein